MSQALCRCGCGFYGNPVTDGMCSKCYKDAMKRKQAPPATSTNTNNISNQISNALSNSLNESNASNVVASLAAALNVLPELGFPCRCGGIFCASHRYANEHSCTFDYKEHGAEEIRKNNPQIVGEKIQKI
ncbi:hypothetical protein RND71_043860 [Anisodus tanguticus]|uniref:A20-type domain-containing protein n=1 Tax=Anisodus tanguticus TaxID=243964 RepID=A0AAE1ULX7_9SOLA|nr:hypothetical protein RND71_043860 [Anisodus tanguticus]